jgi:hypothetical protein
MYTLSTQKHHEAFVVYIMGHVSIYKNILVNKGVIRIQVAFLKRRECYCVSNIRKSSVDHLEVNLNTSLQEINNFVIAVGM